MKISTGDLPDPKNDLDKVPNPIPAPAPEDKAT